MQIKEKEIDNPLIILLPRLVISEDDDPFFPFDKTLGRDGMG